MDLDARLLRAFVVLSEELHFGRAAARLFISQPTLTHAIRRLEQQVGRPLFERTSRRVELTAAGQRMLPLAREVVAANDRAVAAARALQSDAGPLRVGSVPGLFVAREAAEPYVDAQPSGTPSPPGPVLVMHELTSDEQGEALLTGDLDVGIARVSVLPAGLVAVPLRVEAVVALVSVGGSLAAHPAVRAADVLASSPDTARWTSWQLYVRSWARRFGAAAPRDLGAGLAAHHNWQLALSRGAAPRALLTLRSYPGNSQPDVVVRPLAGAQPYYVWSLVVRAADPDPRVAEFVQAARRRSQESGWLEPDPDLPGEPWLPNDDVHADLLPALRAAWARRRAAPGAPAR